MFLKHPCAEQMQKDGLAGLVRNKGFQFTKTFFPCTSGQIGPYYVNAEAVLENGKNYAQAVHYTATLVKAIIGEYGGRSEDVIISGGESKDHFFSYPVAVRLELSHLTIYDDKIKNLGPKAPLEGRAVIHVADLNKEVSSLRDKLVPKIREMGGTIGDIVFYVDRLEEGVEVMRELGLRSHSVVPLDGSAWQNLLDSGTVSEEMYGTLMRRMEDRRVWAHTMLRSDAGFERLVQLYQEESTINKAIKILKEGYPELQKELCQRALDRKINIDLSNYG